jgi:hypothetical protein
MKETKVCRRCKTQKPRTHAYFYRNKQNVADGLANICIVCKKEQHKERRFKEKNHIAYRDLDFTSWMGGDEIYV